MAKKKKNKNLHVKPTEKELEESIKKTAEEAEALKDKPEPTPEPEPKPKEPLEEPEPTPSEPAPSKEIVKDMLKREKKKSVASAQEAQVLHARNKKMNEALDKAQETPDPTEEDMIVEYPDWEMMSDSEKKMAKDTLLSKRRFAALNEVTKDFKESDKWQEKVEAFLDDPKTLTSHPGLEGRGDEFKLFATKPTRRGVDFTDLISAFLYTAEEAKPKKKKSKMFEDGTGGPGKSSKNAGKISIEEARLLRKTDYKKYKEVLMAGKISTEI